MDDTTREYSLFKERQDEFQELAEKAKSQKVTLEEISSRVNELASKIAEYEMGIMYRNVFVRINADNNLLESDLESWISQQIESRRKDLIGLVEFWYDSQKVSWLEFGIQWKTKKAEDELRQQADIEYLERLTFPTW